MSDASGAESIGYGLAILFMMISFIHYSIIKCIYRGRQLNINLLRYGIALGLIVPWLANLCFRLPMLIIYIFSESKNNFAAFITLFLSFISCFVLAFFTHYFMSFIGNKMIKYLDFMDNYGSLVLSAGFYPIYLLFYCLIDFLYFFNIYAEKYLKFSPPKDVSLELDILSSLSIFGLHAVSVCICLYNGNICTWFYSKKKDKKLFLKCLLFPSIVTTFPFFAWIIYKIATNKANIIICIIMCLIGDALSIYLRIRVFKELYSEATLIDISKDEEDDLVEYIDDTICLENFNIEKNLYAPKSFSGIKFGYVF